MSSRSLVMFLVALVSAVLFYLAREHWAHIFGLLPYVLFLACPLMHLFMHHDHHASEGTKPAEDKVQLG